MLGHHLKAACLEKRGKWDKLVPLILMSYRATAEASMGMTQNMISLGSQTRLPIQAIHGVPLKPDVKERTVR